MTDIETMRRENAKILAYLDERETLPGKQVQCEPDVPDTARVPSGVAAKLLGISRDTLRKHTEMGYIRCIYNRVNKRKLYKGSEIKRYWKSYL
jgi:hypothetical protein